MTAERQPIAFHSRSHPHLYEINTWVWLEQLSQRHVRQIRLAEVPDEEWDQLASLGFDFIWLMGVWQRSPQSARVFQEDGSLAAQYDQALPGWGRDQVVGSPYAVAAYRPDPRIGTWADLDAVRHKLHARKMGLILDFVPNHTALDHTWTRAHPEYYIQGTEEDFQREPDSFFLVETGGRRIFIARGKDPYFPPWKDVAQLNFYQPAMRAALLAEVREIARHCDGVRCDMAMLVLNEVFSRTWSRFVANLQPPNEEFWTPAIGAIPGFVWLGEVYWGMERRLQELGFMFTYDKVLYDLLRDNKPQELQSHLTADLAYQNCLARFLENHDEQRSAAVFGIERLQAAATIFATLPGMRFYHQGQLEGRRVHLPICLGNAAEEKINFQISSFYAEILRLTNQEVFHSGEWRLLEVGPAGDASFQNLIAYQWRSADAWKVIAANPSHNVAQGHVALSDQVPLVGQFRFTDELDGTRYPWECADLVRAGLYVRLDAFGAHLFDVSVGRPATIR